MYSAAAQTGQTSHKWSRSTSRKVETWLFLSRGGCGGLDGGGGYKWILCVGASLSLPSCISPTLMHNLFHLFSFSKAPPPTPTQNFDRIKLSLQSSPRIYLRRRQMLVLCKCRKNHLGCLLKHIGWAQSNTLDRGGEVDEKKN